MTEVTITAKKDNPALKRHELRGTMSFTGATPSNDQCRKAIASAAGAAEDAVAVKQVLTQFGKTQAVFHAYTYASKEQLVKVEPKAKPKKEKKAAEPAT
ncbi:hypothetical protein HY642_06135 [Candidatus Woesearchaeota archaeon]|nr:hypothetical protein [Candidatus Woesearchaeota archaeon]